MGNFNDVIGHDRAKDYLERILKTKKVTHAYIFNGPKGSGKKMLSKAFAKALLCEEGTGTACGICRSCKQFLSGNQPDLRMVAHEKPKVVSVDEIRDQLVGDILIKPYSSNYKIYIVDDAQLMNQQAQNALLKTIEEPPSYGIIMLLTTDADKFLPTILSRCVTINLKPVNQEDIVNYLMERYRLPDYRAKICAAFSGGIVGRAVDMAVSDEFSSMYDLAVGILKKIDNMSMYEIMDTIKAVNDYKLKINEFIDLMEMWYRDVLVMLTAKDEDSIIFKEEISYIEERVQRSTPESLNNIIKAMEEAKKRIGYNVNFDTSIEMMLLAIKEN